MDFEAWALAGREAFDGLKIVYPGWGTCNMTRSALISPLHNSKSDHVQRVFFDQGSGRAGSGACHPVGNQR